MSKKFDKNFKQEISLPFGGSHVVTHGATNWHKQ